MNQQYSSMPHQQPHTDQDPIRIHDGDQSANASDSHDNHDGSHDLQQQIENANANANGHQSLGESDYRSTEQAESDLLEKELEKITKFGVIDDHDNQHHHEQHFEVQSHLQSVSPEAEGMAQQQHEHGGIETSITHTHQQDHSSHNNDDDSGNSNIDYLNNFSIEHMTNEDLAMHLQKMISDTSPSNDTQTSETHEEQGQQRKPSVEITPEDAENDSRAPTTEVDNNEHAHESEPVD
ncbi:unnamed protein product, partial [Ambrosiozyma monospora]